MLSYITPGAVRKPLPSSLCSTAVFIIILHNPLHNIVLFHNYFTRFLLFTASFLFRFGFFLFFLFLLPQYTELGKGIVSFFPPVPSKVKDNDRKVSWCLCCSACYVMTVGSEKGHRFFI